VPPGAAVAAGSAVASQETVVILPGGVATTPNNGRRDHEPNGFALNPTAAPTGVTAAAPARQIAGMSASESRVSMGSEPELSTTAATAAANALAGAGPAFFYPAPSNAHVSPVFGLQPSTMYNGAPSQQP
jgi:hypothetical protein